MAHARCVLRGRLTPERGRYMQVAHREPHVLLSLSRGRGIKTYLEYDAS
ncbi:hypothetical protein ppKF707_4392 [Metapseudomonas furukawaii]|uniref:Uncharacterized protein n=1 Tax=Metapseudomonas furukawaii TaxID=1149133 RepID=A0AAD1C1R8_METFU|nr:hypothetical protein ppKF707_4392 [Pseudomonas furukawaii]BAU75751.1 hypothetical protein KF707C_40630 [Pseudomonas furukawaii]